MMAVMVMAPVFLMPLRLRLRLVVMVVLMVVVACWGVFRFCLASRIKAHTFVLNTEVIDQPRNIIA